MFRQISSWWQDRRIAWAYRSHRAKLFELHQADAEVRYPVAQKRADIDAVQKQARRSAVELYGNELGSIERKLSQTRGAAKERCRQLDLIQEDIEPKINAAVRVYGEKRQKMGKLLEEKNEAEDDLADARTAVTSWYEDTTDWLGNRYPDIPQSSFFGRNWDELKDLKEEVSDASGDVAIVRREIKELQGEMHVVSEKLKTLESKRSEKREMARKGVTESSLRRAMDLLTADANDLEERHAALMVQSTDHVAAFEADSGLHVLLEVLDTLIAEQQIFLDAFHEEAIEQVRRESHRAEWLNAKEGSRAQV